MKFYFTTCPPDDLPHHLAFIARIHANQERLAFWHWRCTGGDIWEGHLDGIGFIDIDAYAEREMEALRLGNGNL